MFDLPSGTIDLHVHAAPDGTARRVDALGLARAGVVSGAVFKGHHAATGGIAALVRQEVPAFRAFGSVVMNHAVGGLNPAAVVALAQVSMGSGGIVWLPTRDAENDISRKGRKGPPVAVVQNGRPVDDLFELAEVAAAHGLVLASGHLAPAETVAVFTALERAGVRLLATHVTASVTSFTFDEMAAVLAAGATAELCARNLLIRRSDRAETDAEKLAAAAGLVRRFGAENFVLSSDLGDPRYPDPADGLRAVAESLAVLGVGDPAMEELLVKNPRRLLDLERTMPT